VLGFSLRSVVIETRSHRWPLGFVACPQGRCWPGRPHGRAARATVSGHAPRNHGCRSQRRLFSHGYL